MKICVHGAGAWGTALAVNAAGRHEVTLWARDAAQAAAISKARENVRYLPGLALPPALTVRAGDLHQAQAGAELVVVATPMAALRQQLIALRGTTAPVAWLCKGVEPALDASSPASYGLLAHEIWGQVAPELMAGVLSGPSFAQEVAEGRPTALVAASPHAAVRDALVDAFHGPALRVYANDDIVGVEVGGAVKNVLAIATGLCDGLALGLNARAALITRGLAEMTRFGLALGARAETFMGLSGLGDLVLTSTGDLSRNRKVGQQLAQGLSLEEILQALGHVAEGVRCARAVLGLAQAQTIDMPITEAVCSVLFDGVAPRDAVSGLLRRDAKAE